MTNKIKEILEKPNVYSFNDEYYLCFSDYNILKNYITNLENINKDNEDTIIDKKECIEALKDSLTNLQEENKFLKLNNPEMNIRHFAMIKENKRKIDNLRVENKRLNNIINELEKDLKKYDLEYLYETYDTHLAEFIEVELGKLKELKENK